MKKILILLVIGITLTCTAQAQLLTEHFGYTTGNLGTVGSGGGWSGSNSGVTITTNGLDGTGVGLADPSGNKVTTTTSSSSGTYNQFSTGIKTGSVYYSFLLRVNSTSGLDSTGLPISGLVRNGSASSYYNDVWLRLNGSNVEIGLSKVRNGTTWSASPLTVGTLYLIVTKYQFGPVSGDDVVSLWVNPTTGGTNEPTATVSFSSGGDGNNSTGIGRCYIYGGCSADLDEVRIGATWTDVTPSASIPPPPPSNPVITNVTTTVDGFVINGSGGAPNGDYDVLSSTDLTIPVSSWPVLATDPFDSNGNFSFLDTLTGDEPQKFYAIRTGNTNAPPPTPPSITVQPHDTTNLVGNSASFTVGASGTAPLSFQWYFNSSTPVAGGTSATLTLLNIQTNNAGGYSAIVSNAGGSVTSVVASLVVTNIETPPFISTQPQNQTVAAGQTANFSVVAGGSVPLYYQWYLDDVTPLTDQTNALLSLPGVTTNDAGAYSVIVSNAFGTTNSVDATLTVNTNTPPDFGPIGFCNNGATITGGAGGPTVYVGSQAELQAYSQVYTPYIIMITNSFAITGLDTHIYSNKTVIGVGNVVLTGGGLYLYRAQNVIIRNLTINVADASGIDGIGIHYSHNLWIDHCTIIDASDGAIDITQSSDYITISWCKFIYTYDHDHDYVNLIASSDSDNGSQYHITFHHNWWSTYCVERMPSVRFGRVHVFNNYYNAPGNDYCVRTRKEAEVLVENNYFENARNPWEQYITGGGDTQGKLFAANNNVGFLDTAYGCSWSGTHTNKDGTIVVMIPGTDTVFTPSYSYTMDNALDVKNLVIDNTGAGKGPFAP
jgi:pectate lyase